MAFLSWSALRVVVLAAVLPVSACKARRAHGELFAPGDAPAWETRFAVAFDDDYTAEDLELRGRAPHDVLDQRLFASRLGYAAIVALVRVDQVWGRGRYQGHKDQYLDVTMGEVLLGRLPKGTRNEQLLRVTGEDDLPGDLQGKALVVFLRWAPGDTPSYHHHLMPAEEGIVRYIRTLVKHAQSEGALDGKRGKGKRRARGSSGRARAKTDASAP